jgi:hypothetical protein
MHIRKTISSVRKASKINKQIQKAGDIFQTLNDTIHQAAPFIEYAIDAVQTRFSKVNLCFFGNDIIYLI